MTEKEAIKTHKELKRYKKIIESIDTDFFFEFAETLLNLLEKKDRTIQQLKDENKTLNRQAQQYFEQGIKKDKVIDEMARAFKQDDIRNTEEIKQYFERKVENE